MPDDQIWIFSKITLGIKYRIDWKMNWKIKIQVIREFNSPFISYLYWIPIFCNSSGHPNEGFYTLVISDSFNSGNHSFMLNWEQWWGKDAYCNTEWSMNSSNNISCLRVGLWRKLSTKELMPLNCSVGEDSWEQMDQPLDLPPVNGHSFWSWSNSKNRAERRKGLFIVCPGIQDPLHKNTD